MNIFHYLNRVNFFSAQTLTFCVFIIKKNVNNQTLFFLHMFVGLGTTAITQLKIEKRMMRVFFISSGKTYTFLGNVA